MVSDSIVNSSIPSNASKDFGKKKRANRSAKLKQCKLDARRQQWLSQVKNKGPDDEESGNGSGSGSVDFNGPTIEAKKGKLKGKEPYCKGPNVRSVSVKQIHNHDSDSEESLMANSPTGSVNISGNNYAGSSGSSSSSSSSSASSLSFGSGGCCSGSITEEEEGGGAEFGGGDDGCLDDWETVADALVDAEAKRKQSLEASDGLGLALANQEPRKQNVDKQGAKGKAWRPDDAFRPQNLPNLSKHKSFPTNSERFSCHGLNPWVKMPPVPTSCPICCEDLDLTDSSFLPCPCGFHLCLFCHKRILEEDARCPGCRKPYVSEAVEKETSVSGGSLTIRLARSHSMFSRG